MKGHSIAKTASLCEVLVFYDGPQLLLLKTDRTYSMLAVAISRNLIKHPFFAVEVKDKVLDRYFDGKADLHFVFKNALGHRYYFFDLETSKNKTVELEKATTDEAQFEPYWPEPGAFSRMHTNPFKLRELAEAALKVFNIDGTWGANDFSQFHGKMSDLYAFYSLLNNLDGSSARTERGYMKRAIQERFWQGGGSYLGFYDDLEEHVKSISPLEVARIQYASPGQIAFRGGKDALADIEQIMEVFEKDHDKLAENYRSIRRVLQKNKLLKARKSTTFPSKAVEGFVYDQTQVFGQKMKLEKINDIFLACDENVLIFSKVMLSIYRRARDLYMFHAESRVQGV